MFVFNHIYNTGKLSTILLLHKINPNVINKGNLIIKFEVVVRFRISEEDFVYFLNHFH